MNTNNEYSISTERCPKKNKSQHLSLSGQEPENVTEFSDNVWPNCRIPKLMIKTVIPISSFPWLSYCATSSNRNDYANIFLLLIWKTQFEWFYKQKKEEKNYSTMTVRFRFLLLIKEFSSHILILQISIVQPHSI